MTELPTQLPAELRAMLVCPACRGALRDDVDAQRPHLVCDACRVAYPVERGIPVLLRERAIAWTRS